MVGREDNHVGRVPLQAARHRLRHRVVAVIGLAALAAVAAGESAFADEAQTASELAALREEVETLRRDYERRIAALEARLATLESAAPRIAEPAADELAALRDAAREASAPAAAESPASAATTAPPVGHERNLNRLNPEVSFTGDVLGLRRDSDNDFDAREFELDLRSALDPFSYTKWTLAFAEEEVEIEEGYIGYAGLSAGLGLRAGKMRQTFGPLNRFHLHALPQPDYPLVLQRFFDEEGLAQTGVSLEWLVPRPWASANELTVQLTDGSSEPFGGESFDRLAGLVHLKNYWDLSPATYFEWGLSGIAGRPETGRSTKVWGTDLTLHWQPPARAKYREITWRTELLLSQRDDPTGAEREAWGGYSYLEGLLRRNLYAGVRFDQLEDPLEPSLELRAIEPYLTWWQSEFVRLRLAYQRSTDDRTDETDHNVRFQVTWSAGPHKHEAY